jgi:hypothetical protein
MRLTFIEVLIFMVRMMVTWWVLVVVPSLFMLLMFIMKVFRDRSEVDFLLLFLLRDF